MENNKETKEKLFVLEVTERQIAIIKAGLQYYWLDDSFGLALWGTMPGATFGSRDLDYRKQVGEIYQELNKSTKIKPNYGYWGNIKQLTKLCKEEYKKAKKEGEEAEQRMYEDAVYKESIQNEIDKLGLNGSEILAKADRVCREQLELERKRRADKQNKHSKSENVRK